MRLEALIKELKAVAVDRGQHERSDPQEASNATRLNSVPNGTFDAVAMTGRDIQEKAAEMNDLMNRIDRMLP